MRLLSIAFLVAAAAACQSESVPPVPSGSVVQWVLPDRLREISGLALTRDERLLAVADESAVVYQIDYEHGGLVKSFAVGEPTLRGDFEGIAVLGDTIWLMDSDGRLIEFQEGEDGARVPYERVDIGLDDECEFEGLASDEMSGRLLMACKESRKKKKGLRIFSWRPGDASAESIELPAHALLDKTGEAEINPSGIAIDPGNEHRVVVAARQRVIFRLTPRRELAGDIMRLHAGRHQQAEGIEITIDGRLLVADEAGNGPARLAVYPATTKE